MFSVTNLALREPFSFNCFQTNTMVSRTIYSNSLHWYIYESYATFRLVHVAIIRQYTQGSNMATCIGRNITFIVLYWYIPVQYDGIRLYIANARKMHNITYTLTFVTKDKLKKYTCAMQISRSWMYSRGELKIPVDEPPPRVGNFTRHATSKLPETGTGICRGRHISSPPPPQLPGVTCRARLKSEELKQIKHDKIYI
jgi:hypothetical protein